MGAPRRLLRAAGSVFGLGALAGGVPALLVLVVGWPLPHGLPKLDEVRTALTDGWKPDERFVLGLLALVFWVLWAQLLRHVVSQLRLELRARRNAPAVGGVEMAPVVFAVGGRRGPTQRLASWLVGGLLLAAPLVPSAAIGAPAPRIPVVLSLTQAMADPLMSLSPPATPFAPVVAMTSAPSYMVHTWADRRDCLWNIAERYLGDPFRWTEIRDLNAERVQFDGRRLGDEPTSWVYPGWELVLPADATGAHVVPAPPMPPAAAPIAPTAATPAPTAPSAMASPATTVSPPTTARSSTTTVTVNAPPVTLPVAGRSTTPTAPATTNGATQEGKGSAVAISLWATRAALAGALGLPVFALGGWLARLRRGRVAQASMARPGRDVVRGGDPALEPLERAARSIAADQAEEWVDATLRALTAALATSSPTATPELRCVRAGDMGVEVLLAHPLPVAPDGWEAADGGHVWRVPADVDLAELASRGGQYPVLAPALVSLGSTPEGPILADLEGFGALSVEGDAARVRAFLAGAALELATASWAQGVDLRVHGLDGFVRLEGAVSDGEELAGEARSTAEFLADALAGVSTLAARVAGPVAAEPWYPMVVVVGPDAEAALVAELAGIAAARTGVALVGAGPLAGAGWQLVVGTEGTAVLKPLGLDVRLAGVDEVPGVVEEREEEAPVVVETSVAAGPVTARSPSAPTVDAERPVLVADQVGLDEAVIATAFNALATVAELDDVAAPIPFAAPTEVRRPALRRHQDCEVWVSILRRAPEVAGWAKEPRGRRKLVEVLVYLAVYAPKRLVPAGELRTHCWPAQLASARPGERARLQEVSADTFHQAVSRLRKQLGEGASGWHLPMAVEGAYGIGAGVGCDWTLFQALTAAAEAASRHDSTKAIALYREALELVEGEPFADVPRGSYAWADSEHLVTDIRLAVTRAAHELAEVAMPTEPETALWATQRGLLLLPTQLGLFDTWMTAAGALGDVDGIEQGLQAKCWAHEQLDPEGGVPPETMQLYRYLMGQVTERRMVGQRGG